MPAVILRASQYSASNARSAISTVGPSPRIRRFSVSNDASQRPDWSNNRGRQFAEGLPGFAIQYSSRRSSALRVFAPRFSQCAPFIIFDLLPERTATAALAFHIQQRSFNHLLTPYCEAAASGRPLVPYRYAHRTRAGLKNHSITAPQHRHANGAPEEFRRSQMGVVCPAGQNACRSFRRSRISFDNSSLERYPAITPRTLSAVRIGWKKRSLTIFSRIAFKNS